MIEPKNFVFWDVMVCSLVETAKIWRNLMFLPYTYFEAGEHTWSRQLYSCHRMYFGTVNTPRLLCLQ